jgi:DNA anti-recombination protein RmuC
MTKTMLKKDVPTAKEKEKHVGHDLESAQLVEGGMGERESVDRIRDILFGAQVRQYEQKFSSLEETIRKEVVNLRDDTRKTIETLEKYTRTELESLLSQLKNEQSERSDSASDLSGKLDNLNKSLDKKINRLDEKTNAGQHDLQEQILQQSKNLMKEIQQLHAEISATLKKAVEELRKEKTDRIALGNLFNEIGLRLKEEFKIPDVK